MNDPIFNPVFIKNLEVKNRIYMPAMHLNMAREFLVTDQLVDFYEERSRGGAGMICVGYATVDELSGNSMNIGAHKDEFVPGLSRLAQAIKKHGSKSVVQLNHAGRYNFSFFLDGKKPVAPSPIPSRLTREEPRELTVSDIKEIVASFASAAARCKEAGFDAVEVLSGTGYLISEFLSPLTNQRNDEYGGSLENRMRFGLEIAGAIKESVGKDFPVIFRMNGNDFMEGGQGRLELQEYAVALADSGLVDALCINVGWHEARVPQIVTSVPRGVFGYLARGIKERVNIPVIASHRINEPSLARELIGEGICDMVAMGRSLIADPDLPEKTRKGKEKEIVHCIACAQGCFDNLFKLKAVECLCNPRAGYEKTRSIDAAETSKKVMVVGGGAAGMSAAIAAADRGHKVSLYDQDKILGGQLYLAAAPPGRAEFAEFARDLATQVSVRDIDVHTGTCVDIEIIEKEKPEAVILATGAVPADPPIPGSDLPHVVQAWDVLKEKAHTGSNVVIIGGGAVGVETALFLAEKGTLSGEELKFLLVNRAESPEDLYKLATTGSKNIMLVEMMESIGKDIGKSTRWGMMQDVARLGVRSLTGSSAMEILEGHVVIKAGDNEEKIPADTVVLAAGSRSWDPLSELLKEKDIPYVSVGDADRVALAMDAVHQGYAAGREL